MACLRNVRILSHAEARRVYDWVGKKLDSQSFYEDRATDELTPFLPEADWCITHHVALTPFGLPAEVVVAGRR